MTLNFATPLNMIDQLNQIIPRGLPGVVHCHIEANPEIQFVTWTKDSRLYDPFEVPGIMAMENGSILIDMVSAHLACLNCSLRGFHFLRVFSCDVNQPIFLVG